MLMPIAKQHLQTLAHIPSGIETYLLLYERCEQATGHAGDDQQDSNSTGALQYSARTYAAWPGQQSLLEVIERSCKAINTSPSVPPRCKPIIMM